MYKVSTKIAFVGMSIVTIAGCSSGSQQSTVPTPSTQPVVNNQPTTAEPFVKPLIVTPQQNKSLVAVASGLIQPTNANERAKQVSKGRQDPFAGLFALGVSSGTTNATSQTIVPQLPNLSIAPVPQPIAAEQPNSSIPVVKRSRRTTATPNRSSNPTPPINTSNPNVATKPSPNPTIGLPLVVPESSFEQTFSPPAQPELARSVAVTGVVLVGSEPQAIVKVPNEATSRYVRVGQMLSNGQVLVKRIEMNEGSEPIVILEQYGIEVSRAVGEQPLNPGTGTPTSATQLPPPPDNTLDLEAG